MGAIGGLILPPGVPPRIQVNDVVSADAVEPGATLAGVIQVDFFSFWGRKGDPEFILFVTISLLGSYIIYFCLLCRLDEKSLRYVIDNDLND